MTQEKIKMVALMTIAPRKIQRGDRYAASAQQSRDDIQRGVGRLAPDDPPATKARAAK